MQTVILKNGAEEAKPFVIATMLSLEELITSHPIALYELTMKCRDRNHKFWGSVGSDLKRLALVQDDGFVHDSIKNIVLSAVEGDGLSMCLGSPIKS